MWELFLHPDNLIFSISLCMMLMIGVVEILLLLVGMSGQGFLEQFTPDQLLESHDPHWETDPNVNSNLWIQLLEWLYLGRVPLLVWLIIFLTVFSLSGFFLQSLWLWFSSSYLSPWIIAPLTLILCMPLVRFGASFISKIIPKDETTAIHSNDLLGLSAQIILGEARPQYPAQAKVKDHFGQTHYVLVEPEAETVFSPGQSVILSQKTAQGFKAVLSLDHGSHHTPDNNS